MNLDLSSKMSLEQKIKKFCGDADTDLAKMDFCIDVNRDLTDSAQNNLKLYREEYLCYRQRYEAIHDASFWKMTAPLRKAADMFHYLKTGVKREKEWNDRIKKNETIQSNEIIQVGVHLHLYYVELLEEFCKYLNNMPVKFDLYISCKKGADRKYIARKVHEISLVNHIVIKETPNTGRDIAPFYVLFKKELLEYPFLLHIHTKKSLYTGNEQKEWRQKALDGVLKDSKTIEKILNLLRQDSPQTGLIFGEMDSELPLFALHWLRNSFHGRELLKKMKLPMDNHMLFYPVGSFFWVKTEAIRPIFNLNLAFKDFEEEKGQIDGTMAHALERVISCTVRGQGYNMFIYDSENEKFSLNKSYKSYKKYFNLNVENVEAALSPYELITFDVFDTLMTRLVYEPDDVFRYMERLLKDTCKIDVNFLAMRKKAEELAWQEHGDFCNIHHIYEKFSLVSEFTENEIKQLKQLEIDTEYKFCIPRCDVLKIYNDLLASGKRIVLVSDMYLTHEIIENMLKKCGYTGYEDIWISCEKGKRKDNDTIWDDFFNMYGELKTIHVGDNPHSDCQILSDRKQNYFLLLSSMELFRLSRQYESYLPYIQTTIEHSLLLGYMVNKCLYNSPFALSGEGVKIIDSPTELSSGIYGPLFLTFCDYIQKTSRRDSKLLFLAREGFFLQKLYKKYCKEFKQSEYENVYFMTSRRAASVPQISTYADAKELLQTPFSGNISALFEERYGFKLKSKSEDFAVKLPRDMSKVVKILKNYAGVLLTQAKEEKKHYLSYIEETLGTDTNWDLLTLVDLGYAGTIQYYLMKLLNKKLDGCYLITDYTVKPEKINGTFRSLYNFYGSKSFDDNKLFLEAIAAAPHGQLKYFEINNGKETAVLKDELDIFGKNAMILQEPVYQYLADMGELMEGLDIHWDKGLVECIFKEMLQEGALSPKLQGYFIVEDGYCAGGKWKYNELKNKWDLETRSI